MSADPFVVVGASLAGLRAVEEARAAGYTGRIVLIGSEPHIPYDRPPLSKQFLVPEALPDYLSTEEEMLLSLEVELWLSRTAVSLEPEKHIVRLNNGDSLQYSKLLIATGAEPRTLPIFSDLEGVLTLRTLDDAQNLRARLSKGVNVVIVGAGFIGSEIASSATKQGASVVIVEAAPVPLVRAVGPIVGEAISSLHQRHGVRLLLSAHIDRVIGDGTVKGVGLVGGEILPADVVVVGIGASPATSWLTGSGVALSPVDGGVVCDELLRTTVPDVYAAGDLTHWPNSTLNSTVMRLENWTNAADQGRQAALNALWPEGATAYSTVPYFWSDWYEQRIQFVGTADADEVRFVAGNPDSDKWTALYRSGNRLIGAATLNERRKIMKYRKMISSQATWAEALAAYPLELSEAP